MKHVPLGQLITPGGARARSGSNLPVYSVTKSNGFVPSLEYFKKQVFSRDTDGYRVVAPGDFAYATIHLDEGSLGIAPEAALISPMYTVFRPEPRLVDPVYLFRFMKSPRALAAYGHMGRGAVHRRKSISLSALGQLPVPLPSLDAQRRIAAILDQADAVRTKRRQALAHLDALPPALFERAFGALQAVTTTAGILASGKDRIRTGPFGSQLLHSEFVDEGISVLGLDNVVGNVFCGEFQRFITTRKYESLRRYTVHAGDVLISIMGTTGRCVIVPEDVPVSINTKHICAITCDRRQVVPEFLRACFLWHPESRRHLLRQTKGSIMDGLNMGIIKAMPIPIAAMSEQVRYAAQLKAVAAHRSGVERALDADEAMFGSLQARAFRGEL